MAKMGKFSAADLKKLQKKLNKLQKAEIEKFIEACAKELAARLLSKVIHRTPVGDYSKKITVVAKKDSKNHKKGDTYTKTINPSGKMGGTLRRGWTSNSHKEAETGGKGSTAAQYAESLTINHVGDIFEIEVVNPVEYASYVEYGHRTPNHKGWVQGRFMLTISEQEVQEIAPNVLEAKVAKFLKGIV
jgi:hypothetical protein